MTWVWGAVNAVLIMLVIYCNGRGWRVGWLLGVAAQVWLILFGAFGGGPWTFVFSAGPAAMFAANWLLHPRRTRRKARDVADEQMAAHLRAIWDGRVKTQRTMVLPVTGAELGTSVAEATANAKKLTDQLGLSKIGFSTPSGDVSFPVTNVKVDRPPYPYGGWVAKHTPVDDEQPITITHQPPGMSTDILPATGVLAGAPADPPGGCLLCPDGAEVPQTELIGHLISHHPEAYDGTPYEQWATEDTTEEGER